MLTPDELLEQIRLELVRVYGPRLNERCFLKRESNWFYIGLPVQQADGEWLPDLYVKPVTKKGAENILDMLRKRKTVRPWLHRLFGL